MVYKYAGTMATESFRIVKALRDAASALAEGNDYQWGHMGSCNCGFLAREITQLKKHEIHARAMLRSGDWSDQLNDYCPGSGIPMDDLISDLLAFGFDIGDLRHLERLSDPEITACFPDEYLKFNVKTDVIRYMISWADTIESTILEKVAMPALQQAVRASVT